MRKTLLVMRHELLMTLRRKTYLFFALLLPLTLGLIALVIMLVNRDQPQTTEPEAETAQTEQITALGYIDQAGLVASEPPELPAGTLVPFENEAAATTALTAGEIGGYFIIPPDYLTGGELTYVTDEYSPFNGLAGTYPIEWLLITNLLNDPDQAAAVWQPINLNVRQPSQSTATEETIDQNSWIVEMLPTMMVLIIYMTILIPAGALVNAIANEKKDRVIESVLVSISSRQFITGKILALGLLGLMQIALWMAIVYGVVNFGGRPLNIPASFSVETSLLVWVIIYSLLGYMMYGVLMAGLGALIPDIKDARGISFILMLPLIIAYMFNIVILELPNGPIAVTLSFFPLTAPVAMIGRMSVTDIPMWQGVLSGAIQLLTAIGLLLLVARLFQAKYILSGQPLSAKRYFAALVGRA